jgi:hypothetical protein
MGRDSGAEGWCILRTSPARTLPLAASLMAAGVEAWSPAQMVTRRMGRKRERVEQAAPVTASMAIERGFASAMLAADQVTSDDETRASDRQRHAVDLHAHRAVAIGASHVTRTRVAHDGEADAGKAGALRPLAPVDAARGRLRHRAVGEHARAERQLIVRHRRCRRRR